MFGYPHGQRFPARFAASFCCYFTLLFLLTLDRGFGQLPDGVSFQERNPVNGVSVVVEQRSLAFYRPAGQVESLQTPVAIFLTHARRDMAVSARPLVDDTRIFVPESARDTFLKPRVHWNAWWEDRFDYYGQQVTRRPVQRLAASGFVKDGDKIQLSGETIEVITTPGVTQEGVTYLLERGGKRLAFSGNLLLAGGKVPDLYSFQDAVRDAKVGAYHGYGGRLGPWIASLEKLRSHQPDLIIPSQGPIITDPGATIDTAIEKARAIYANYLSTNALHWYFGEERMRTCADLVLGPDAPMESMPLAEHIDLPDWVQHMGTTKLLVSRDGAGFALDVGSPRSLESLQQAVKSGLVTGIEGIWVTHRHNDHTQAVADAQRMFDCPVYAIENVAVALTDPGSVFSPGISPNVVKDVTTVADGETLKWREFDFTFRFFPGQMLDHGALLVERSSDAEGDGDEAADDPVFFIGDSFSPSGIDDYCLMNRNLMREDTGYLKCFAIVRDELPEDTWLVNQHIPHLFRFSAKELDYLESRYRKRLALIADFTPWDDPNFAVDEQWVWLFPYGQEIQIGKEFTVTLRVMNHSTREREFTATSHFPRRVKKADAETQQTVKIAARESTEVTFTGTVAPGTRPGIQVVTVSLRSDDFNLPHWCEALVRVIE